MGYSHSSALGRLCLALACASAKSLLLQTLRRDQDLKKIDITEDIVCASSSCAHLLSSALRGYRFLDNL